jgi:tetratricopeptide (TPR) repeat protein
LGQLLRLGNQLEQAIAIHQKSQTLATQLQNKQALAEAWFNLSEIYRLKREYEKAETYGQKALAFFNCQTDQARWQATLLNTMGLIALDCDECLQAEARLRESVALWQLLDEPTELARVLKNLGLALQQQQKYIAAYQYYHEALEQLRRTESELDKALIILNIGTLHFVQGEYRQAEFSNSQSENDLTNFGQFCVSTM